MTPQPTQPAQRISLAVKFGMIQPAEGETPDQSIRAKFQLLKDLGYDGVEMDSPSDLDINEVIDASREVGLPIHGVVDSVHWSKPFSHPDPAVRAEGVKALEMAINDCKALGGTTVLVVPAVVNREVSYADAYTRSQEEIRRVLPLAEELGITIAFENVWNNFLLSPLEAARYIDEFESVHVKWYFDVGNIVRYGWPAQWIQILGQRIAKLDIKEYSRKKANDEGVWKGFEVEIGDPPTDEGCDWPSVREALREIEYTGWATAEVGGGGRERLGDILRRMRGALGEE
jgi:hexulose-6-phosphate isomerase